MYSFTLFVCLSVFYVFDYDFLVLFKSIFIWYSMLIVDVMAWLITTITDEDIFFQLII